MITLNLSNAILIGSFASMSLACDASETTVDTIQPDGGAEVQPDAEPGSELLAHCVSDRYTITKLPLPPLAATARAFSINRKGEIVGDVSFKNRTQRSLLWKDGEYIDIESTASLEEFDAGRTTALDVSDDGRVTGFAMRRWDGGSTAPMATLWSSDLGFEVPLPDSPSRGWATNSSGAVAGDQGTAGFFWSPDSGLHDLGVVVGPHYQTIGSVMGLNEAGTVVGASWVENTRTAFRWNESEGIVELPMTAANAGAQAVNEAGDIVGWVEDDEGVPQGAMWQGDELAIMERLPGLSGGQARDINNLGEVVGDDANSEAGLDSHAWLYRDNTKFDLNGFIDDPTWTVENATSINGAAQIVGMGSIDLDPDDGVVDQESIAFLMTPICE